VALCMQLFFLLSWTTSTRTSIILKL